MRNSIRGVFGYALKVGQSAVDATDISEMPHQIQQLKHQPSKGHPTHRLKKLINADPRLLRVDFRTFLEQAGGVLANKFDTVRQGNPMQRRAHDYSNYRNNSPIFSLRRYEVIGNSKIQYASRATHLEKCHRTVSVML